MWAVEHFESYFRNSVDGFSVLLVKRCSFVKSLKKVQSTWPRISSDLKLFFDVQLFSCPRWIAVRENVSFSRIVKVAVAITEKHDLAPFDERNLDLKVQALQRARKSFVNLAKQDPGRARQKSEARVGRNFSQPAVQTTLKVSKEDK